MGRLWALELWRPGQADPPTAFLRRFAACSVSFSSPNEDSGRIEAFDSPHEVETLGGTR